MNFWLLTSEFPPHAPGGGIGAYCVAFASALVEHGHEVTVFSAGGEGLAQVTEDRHEGGFPVVRVPPWVNTKVDQAMGYWGRLSYSMALAVEARISDGHTPPDVLEVQEYGGLGYFLQKRKILGSIVADIPIIVHCHTPVFEIGRINDEITYKFPNYWIGRSEKYSILAADGLLCPSEFLSDRIYGSVGRRPTTLNLPFDVARVPQPVGDPEPPLYDLLYLGRFELRKGVLQLLAEMKSIWDSGRPVRLNMVGGDTQFASRGTTVISFIKERYAQYIARGLLVLTPRMERSQLPSVMAKAKALVVPSLFENFPYVCIEAMAHGLPVVASTSGGQAEMVGPDGRFGFLFSWEEPGSFEKAVTSLLTLTDDDRREMRSAVRTRIGHLCDPGTYVATRVQMARSIGRSKRSEYPFLNRLLPGEDRLPAYQTRSDRDSVMGLISVVIPHYNLGQYLPAALESVVNSTYRNIEVVVVDDGSTDAHSIQYLTEVESHAWRFSVTILRQKNAGLPQARNAGASIARGEFVAFLDADDTVSPEYYAKCHSVLSNYRNVSFAYSWVQHFEQADDVWVTFDTDFPYFLGSNMLAAYPVIRRTDYQSFGQHDPRMSLGLEDFEAWLRLAASGCLGVAIPETLVQYRVRANSMTRSITSGNQPLLRERVSQFNHAAYQSWGAEIFGLLNANGPGWLWNNPSMNYPPIAYGADGTSNSRLATLRWMFSGEQISQLSDVLKEPAVVWLVRAVLRYRLHRLAFHTAKFLLWLRRRLPIPKAGK